MMKKTRVIIMIFLNFFFMGCFGDSSNTASTLPIKIPIDLSKPGDKVEFIIQTDGKSKPYYVQIEFIRINKVENDISDFKILKKIAGETFYRGKKRFGTGVVIPINIKIYKIEENIEKLISDKTYNSQGTGGYSRESIDRDIEKFKLDEGKYKFIVTNIKSIIEMKNRKTNIRFARRSK